MIITESVIIDLIGIKFICNFKTIFIFYNLDRENLLLGMHCVLRECL